MQTSPSSTSSAAAVRRRQSVPARARGRARAPRPRGRGEPALGRDACLSLQLLQLRLRAAAAVRPGQECAWSIASTGRSASIAASTTGPTGGSSRSTASLPTRRSCSRAYSLDKHRELGLELRDPVVIRNSVDPAIFHPPAAREPLAGRRAARDRDELVRQSAQGSRRARVARPEPRLRLLRASRSPATRRRRFERIRVVAPLPSEAARRAAARARRLSRRQPRRSVLERVARSACLRTAGRVPAQRRTSRSSSARRGSGSTSRRSCRQCWRDWRDELENAVPRFVSPSLARRGRPLPRSAARMTTRARAGWALARVRAGAHRVVAGGFAALRRRRRLRLVDRRRPRRA